MKQAITMAMIVLMAAAAQASLWSEDFSAVTWANDPIPTDGDLYPGDVPYGSWGRVNSASVSSGGANNVLWLLGHENGSGRSAVTRIEGSTFGSLTALTMNFDLIDMDPNTELYVEVWEAKNGAQPYYMDTVSANGLGPKVSSWGTAYYQELVAGYWAEPTAAEGTTVSLNFNRLDTSADLILFFHGEKALNTTWWAATDIDNIEIIPEPATFGLLGIAGAGLVYFRRRLYS